MPFDPKTNKWKNTTKALNRERHTERDANKMTDRELLEDAKRQAYRDRMDKRAEEYCG